MAETLLIEDARKDIGFLPGEDFGQKHAEQVYAAIDALNKSLKKAGFSKPAAKQGVQNLTDKKTEDLFDSQPDKPTIEINK